MNLKKTLTTAGAAALLITTTAATIKAADGPTGDASVSFLSKYVWRGYELSKDSIVIQPSVTASYMGFGLNLWGNLDTDQDTALFDEDGANWNETDLTLSYDGSAGMIGYSVGYIYYGLDGAADTQELYAGVGLDTILAPTLTIYRDFAEFPGWYATLEVSHSIQLTEAIALDLGAHVSYLMVDEATTMADPDDPSDEYADFHDGLLSASVTIPLTEHLSITPELYYSFALGSDASDVIKAASADGDDNFLYGGVTLGMAF
ncbi:MAG: hypothetical protein Kow0089_12260 [Desulfobulbaceae bacterium]